MRPELADPVSPRLRIRRGEAKNQRPMCAGWGTMRSAKCSNDACSAPQAANDDATSRCLGVVVGEYRLELDLNQLTERMAMTLACRKQGFSLFHAISFDPPLFGARDQHCGVKDFWFRVCFQLSPDRHFSTPHE
jgi:hypothetical protein